MKKYFKPLLFIAAITILGLSSCDPDDIIPGTGDERDMFVGTWHCSETSETGDQISYTIKIGKEQNSVEVWIEGFAAIGFGDTARGIMAGGDINIYSRTPCPGWTVVPAVLPGAVRWPSRPTRTIGKQQRMKRGIRHGKRFKNCLKPPISGSPCRVFYCACHMVRIQILWSSLILRKWPTK